MKYTKTLFLFLIIVVSFFLQGQASAKNLLNADNQHSNLPLQAGGLSEEVIVYMYKLNENGSEQNSANSICTLGDTEPGCGIQTDDGTGTVIPYPPPTTEYIKPYYDDGRVNPLKVNVDHYYLQNVLPREMDVVGNAPTLAALKAQALAARSIADWKADNWGQDPFRAIANYTISQYQTGGYQVFFPDAYDTYYNHHVSGEKERVHDLIDTAISETSGEYLFYPNNQGFLSIDAEFSNDIGDYDVNGNLVTRDGNQDYLIPIQDPISDGCDLNPVGNGWGMSQKGAIRWSKGNQCAGSGDQPWSVAWDGENGYKQILTHYYTGINILDGSGNPVAPGNRWNLLGHDVPTFDGTYYTVTIQLQNTSTSNWETQEIMLGYQWTAKGDSFIPGNWSDNVPLPEINKGAPITGTLQIPPPSSSGNYTLHLDLRNVNEGGWFSEQSLGWPDATIDIDGVVGPTATPTILTETPTPTLSPATTTFTPTITATPTLVTGLLTCNTVAEGVTCTDKGSYLDYNININVTGLTGGATAYNIFIGTYKRSTSGGYMGMMSDFVHSETSNYSQNRVLSLVAIKPFDAGRVDYPSFISGSGTNVSVTNQVSEWRYISGTGGWPNTLSVRGNVDWALTGYSIVGHIYLYSNQKFPCPDCRWKDCSDPDPELSASAKVASLSQAFDFITNNFDRIADQATLLYRIRDEVLNTTEEGQRYIDLYYSHSAEIAAIMYAYPEIDEQGLDLIDALTPNLQALLDGQGNSVIITNGQIQQAQTFLDAIMSYASPGLQQAIANERTLHPLENMVGMTMSQARDYALDVTIPTETPTVTQTDTPPSTPTATSTLTSTTTDTPTITPTETVTATPANTPTGIATATEIQTPIQTPTGIPTYTATATLTFTPTVTPTETSTPNSCTPSNAYGQSGSGYHLASLNSAPLLANFERLPLAFVSNQGQEDGAVKFNAKGLGGNLFFTPGEVVFSLPNPVKVKEREDEKEKIRYDLNPANVVRIHYQGANDNPEVVPIGQLPGVVNVLKGNNASKWRTNLPTYSGIAYRELYPGVELRYEGTDVTLKSTFHVAPGADPSAIVWRYKGVDSLSTDEAGNLVVDLPEPAGNGAVMIEQAPIAWQVVNDNRVMVAVQYMVSNNDKKVSFAFPDGYDQTLPLVIDPTITYSTYLGGGRTDEGHAITLDADCNVYITGDTHSSDFPTVDPLQPNPPSKDIFVSKLNAAGDTLLYSTYLGGNESDQAWGVALDSQGRITIVGESESNDFPMQNAYNSTFAGGICSDGEPCDDVVVTQLNPDGASLRYSTYLGGTQEDNGLAMAIGPGDLIHFTGSTRSSAFPTFHAYDSSFGGGSCSSTPCYDAFVATINPSLTGSASLLYSTFLGNDNYDDGMGIAVDSAGQVYVAGYTKSTGFPVRNAYQATRAGSTDAFIAKFDTTLSGDASLLYSTYFGGSADDRAFGIALHGANQVYVTGFTKSTNLPLANPFDDTFGGGTCGTQNCADAFVAHLDITSNTLVASSYLGGGSADEGAGITVDPSGDVHVTGFTKSTDFTTLDAIQPTKGTDACSAPPCSDAFVAKISATGNPLIYSTYLGGSEEDYGNAILVDGFGNTYIVGYTFSSNFPTTPNSFPYVGGSGYSDAFVVKIDD